MLRKKEKKAITSIIALLIGWPIGLDKFVEGQNEEGVKTILTWLLIIIGFVAGAALNEFGYILLSLIGGFVGIIFVLRKLVIQLKAFEEAED